MYRARRRKAHAHTQAEGADRFDLYQRAVQEVEAEIDFVDETFRTLRARQARILREDFCGTANTACEWVRRRKSNLAIAVDLDDEPLQWGLEHNVAKLPSGAAARIRLLRENVLSAKTRPADIILAMNFSYWLFRDRRTMKRYFRRVRHALVADGLFLLDAYGGYDAPRVIEEARECDGFTYEWEQASYNPITGEMACFIHFAFPDGSRLERAFSYTWRLWTLPEIRELLLAAGFARTTVYWQGWDEETGEPDGIFEPTEIGEPDAGWICYVVAEK